MNEARRRGAAVPRHAGFRHLLLSHFAETKTIGFFMFVHLPCVTFPGME